MPIISYRSPHSPGSFDPPNSYWKEIDKQDKRIFALSDPVATVVIGIPLRSRQAVWESADTDSPFSYWSGLRVPFGPRALSALLIPKFIAVDPRSEGLATDSYTVSEQSLIDKFRYCLTLRSLDVFSSITPDSSEPARRRQSKHEKNLELGLAQSGITQEHYDFLISELQRGASGDFALSYDAILDQERD